MSVRKREYYRGIPMAPYDLVKELLIALGVIAILVVILSAVLSSPDEPPLTLKSVAQNNPQIFVQTSLDMLDGNSPISSYGPPYNTGTGSVQYIGPVSLQNLFGVHIPIDTAQDYVLAPLGQMTPVDRGVGAALAAYDRGSAVQQAKWTDAYNAALSKAKENPPGLAVPACTCGPVPVMMSAMLQLGQSGALDGLLLTSGHFYQTDYTRPLLFMNNDAVANHAAEIQSTGQHLGRDE